MHNRYHQLRQISLGLLLILFLIGSGLIYQRELLQQEQQVSVQVQERAHRLKEQVLLARAYVDSVARLLQDRLSLPEVKAPIDISTLSLWDEATLGSDAQIYGFQISANAQVSGLGNIHELKQQRQWSSQLRVLRQLNGVFESAVHTVPDLNWFYFTSRLNFIFLAPKTATDFQFTHELYDSLHWQGVQALEAPNHLLVTGRYWDAAGSGEIITLAMPVREPSSGRLLGVVGLDLRLASLIEGISFDDVLGDSLLIDSAGNLIVRSKPIVEEGVKTLVQLSRLPISEIIIPRQQLTLVHYVSNRQYYWAAIKSSAVKWLLLFVALALVHTIVVLRLLISRIEVLANTDPLTSLLNRRAMAQHLKLLININQRYQQRLCLLLMDIDHFKSINDTHGHDVGDQVLVQLSRLLAETLRQSDLLSRHGGEEFLVALPNTSLDLATDLAERIRVQVSEYRFGPGNISMTISMGCVELADTENYNHAIGRADQLLYRAKETGRNRVCGQSELAHK